MNASGFDDVYILSLPSFQWINWWNGSDGGNPHNSLTCNVVNKGQSKYSGNNYVSFRSELSDIIHFLKHLFPANLSSLLPCTSIIFLKEVKLTARSSAVLIIGGTFPLSQACDSPSTWGTHNLDLAKKWNPYEVNITSYVVPPEVISVVGGS